jgi:hypothetical protein
MTGDSDDGIVTRSVLYLFDQIAKAPHGCKYTMKYVPFLLHHCFGSLVLSPLLLSARPKPSMLPLIIHIQAALEWEGYTPELL